MKLVALLPKSQTRPRKQRKWRKGRKWETTPTAVGNLSQGRGTEIVRGITTPLVFLNPGYLAFTSPLSCVRVFTDQTFKQGRGGGCREEGRKGRGEEGTILWRDSCPVFFEKESERVSF